MIREMGRCSDNRNYVRTPLDRALVLASLWEVDEHSRSVLISFLGYLLCNEGFSVADWFEVLSTWPENAGADSARWENARAFAKL